ncbi:MAG: hypothetical protein WB699_16165 [Bacteroidota bacterium]
MTRNHCFVLTSVLLAGLLAGGCNLLNPPHDDEYIAAAHMETAETHEEAGDLSYATREYDMVAMLYPNYSDYPRAVMNAARLFLTARNPAANDSSALTLLTLYLTLPVPEETKAGVRTQLALLERVMGLRALLARTEHSLDSLGSVTRKQTASIGAQSQRQSELETELRQTKEELARLKEVDVRLSRTQRRR